MPEPRTFKIGDQTFYISLEQSETVSNNASLLDAVVEATMNKPAQPEPKTEPQYMWPQPKTRPQYILPPESRPQVYNESYCNICGGPCRDRPEYYRDSYRGGVPSFYPKGW